mmetsp:Transcript_26801/g.78012  ORF Transcript_26801/g.78012 Transcript_26801/m.78012 type:complete len:564 (+) Transcript_26801:912-2603(+)
MDQSAVVTDALLLGSVDGFDDDAAFGMVRADVPATETAVVPAADHGETLAADTALAVSGVWGPNRGFLLLGVVVIHACFLLGLGAGPGRRRGMVFDRLDNVFHPFISLLSIRGEENERLDWVADLEACFVCCGLDKPCLVELQCSVELVDTIGERRTVHQSVVEEPKLKELVVPAADFDKLALADELAASIVEEVLNNVVCEECAAHDGVLDGSDLLKVPPLFQRDSHRGADLTELAVSNGQAAAVTVFLGHALQDGCDVGLEERKEEDGLFQVFPSAQRREVALNVLRYIGKDRAAEDLCCGAEDPGVGGVALGEGPCVHQVTQAQLLPLHRPPLLRGLGCDGTQASVELLRRSLVDGDNAVDHRHEDGHVRSRQGVLLAVQALAPPTAHHHRGQDALAAADLVLRVGVVGHALSEVVKGSDEVSGHLLEIGLVLPLPPQELACELEVLRHPRVGEVAWVVILLPPLFPLSLLRSLLQCEGLLLPFLGFRAGGLQERDPLLLRVFAVGADCDCLGLVLVAGLALLLRGQPHDAHPWEAEALARRGVGHGDVTAGSCKALQRH